jgi:glycosyltransferase involved in cell wall biosynthesis
MRIAAITNSRIPSTTANSLQALKVCDALVEVGNEVKLYAPAETSGASWPNLAQKYGLHHEFALEWFPSWPALRRLDFVAHARLAARRYGAELIYTWLPQAAALEARLRGPVILEMHADVAGRLGAWWLRQFWRSQTSRLLVTTLALRHALERSTGMRFPDHAVQVAPNSVDLQRYADLPPAPQARAQLRLPARFTIGLTGHFYAGRGVDLLQRLARVLPELHFLLVGGTANAVTLLRQRLEESPLPNLTLTGYVDNARLPLFQAASDILVMPYSGSVAASSGQEIAEIINPMKMFEYMAAGRPIVTSDLPVIREVLDETRAEFCPSDDTEAWKSAILALKSDPARRAALAASARREVRKYTWRRRAKRAIEGMG